MVTGTKSINKIWIKDIVLAIINLVPLNLQIAQPQWQKLTSRDSLKIGTKHKSNEEQVNALLPFDAGGESLLFIVILCNSNIQLKFNISFYCILVVDV